ncbi:MAG: hypothetical protein U0793_00420 [Gemmataceae bacterium]
MKAPILNIYYLLCYAWDYWKEGQLVNISHEPFHSLPDLLVHVLNAGTGHLLRRGVDQRYLAQEDDLSSPRGRIDIGATLTRLLTLRSRLCCVYDELSHDVHHNRIIKATLCRAARAKDLEKRLAEESSYLYRRLHEISDMPLSASSFCKTDAPRIGRFYSFLLEVCRILYYSLLVDPKTGGSVFRDVLQDDKTMNGIFEQFIRKFYAKEQTLFNVSAKTFKWIDVDAKSDDDRSALPLMKTDVTLESAKRVIILDAKYYASCLQTSQYGKATIHSGNLYQLYAYMRNAAKKYGPSCTVEGILIYPVLGQPLDLHFRIHGHPVSIVTVDLNQHWTGIKHRLLEVIT